MSNFQEFDIKLEKADEKGMLNVKVIKEFMTKAEKAVCDISLSNGFGSGFFPKFLIHKIIIFYWF